MLRKLILFLLLSGSAYCQLINPHELPFGCYSSHWANDTFFTDHPARLKLMHDTLGFNQHMSGGFTDQTISTFLADTIAPYPWVGTGADDWQVSYAECQYLICHPESSDVYNCTFKTQYKIYRDSTNSCVYGTDSARLADLNFSQPSRYNELDGKAAIQYFPEFRIRVSSRTPGDDSNAVAIYKADRDCCGGNTGLVFLDTIKFGYLNNTQFTELSLFNRLNQNNRYCYIRPPDDTINHGDWVKYSLEICSPCTVYVDWFKIYCQNGKYLIEDTSSLQNRLVKQSISRTEFDGRILGWFLKDTEQPGNYRPMAHIDSLIRYASRWRQPVRGVAWVNQTGIRDSHAQTYRDFVRITKPEMLWTYLYPIDRNTAYTGYVNANHGESLYFHSDSLQRDFASCITDPLDSLRLVLPQAGANR